MSDSSDDTSSFRSLNGILSSPEASTERLLTGADSLPTAAMTAGGLLEGVGVAD